jgi:hypothetical protein
VTSGDDSGTSGDAGKTRWRPGPWLMVAIVSFVVIAVNATSDYLDMSRSGRDFDWWEPFVWEASSGIIIVAMAPLIGLAMQRWPFTRDSLVRPALIHFALTAPFSAIHIVAIYLLRNAIYAVIGGQYGFFDDGVGLVLVYEWRKDVLTYSAIAAFYGVFQYIEARRAAAADAARTNTGDERIEIRDGGMAVFLAPRDVLFVEAAGNYIEFHTAGRTHMVRATLAAWEQRLASRGFVRVHRSRLVNRTRIASLKPTSAGDVEIALDDGRTLLGSRRYRAALSRAQ